MRTTTTPTTAPTTARVDITTRARWWAKTSAAIYDPFLWMGERVGMRAMRHSLLAQATGTVLEIGAGTGLNVAHYPTGLWRLLLAEPDPSMRRALVKRAAFTTEAEVIDPPAEHLPLPDDSVDTVVSTLVLCTVDAPDRALAEIARVLRPGGRLLFVEHVRAESPRLARWQDRLARPWRAFARGCRCNRATTELMTSCGFTLEHTRNVSWRAMPPIVRPLVVGHAIGRTSDV